jgi:AraC family transcriptional regulator
MDQNILLVKNMVCHRCVLSVQSILKELTIPYQQVVFGEIHLPGAISDRQKEQLKKKLESVGFELIDSHLTGLIEKIKKLLIQKARNEVETKESKLTLSAYLASKTPYEYTYLSSLFSSVEGRTIENYFIEQRIEKAKEMMIYGDKTLSQIAYELDYSSSAHLSAQFKKVTGLTPSYFKEVGNRKRKGIDNV